MRKYEKPMILIKDKMTLTIPEAAAYSNIGINKIDAMTKDPRCNFVLYVGRKRLIKRAAFEKYINSVLEI